jgi:serine phosphatase RsbU (regulator of sigma subunit)
MTDRAGAAAPGDSLVELALDRLSLAGPDDVPAVLSDVAAQAGLADLAIYLADLQQATLIPWPRNRAEPERVDGTIAGRAFQRGTPVQAGGGFWWIPIIDGGDRLGVMRFEPTGPDEVALLVAADRLAALTGLVITSRRACSDGIDVATRTHEVTLAAETRWALLPPRTLLAPGVCVSAHLEPAYEIAGDSFDYALNGDVLDLAVFDAMGHGLTASRLANLAMTSYRHSRRAGAGLDEIYHAMDQVILDEFGDGGFVTAHLARLQISTGVLSVVNAGHPHPLLIRGGSAHPLEFAPATPIGLGFVSAEVGEVRLEPGDVVIILSDGVTEAKSAGGDLFGIERVGDLAVRAIGGGESVPETVRRLVTGVLAHRSVELEDDASLVMLSWRP